MGADQLKLMDATLQAWLRLLGGGDGKRFLSAVWQRDAFVHLSAACSVGLQPTVDY